MTENVIFHMRFRNNEHGGCYEIQHPQDMNPLRVTVRPRCGWHKFLPRMKRTARGYRMIWMRKRLRRRTQEMIEVYQDIYNQLYPGNETTKDQTQTLG